MIFTKNQVGVSKDPCLGAFPSYLVFAKSELVGEHTVHASLHKPWPKRCTVVVDVPCSLESGGQLAEFSKFEQLPLLGTELKVKETGDRGQSWGKRGRTCCSWIEGSSADFGLGL